MQILGISGSLRSGSHNTQLLREAARLLPDGVEFELYDGLKAVPAYDEDDEPDRPKAVAQLVDAVVRADAIVFATPEYNSSIPGHLKNAIDWLSRPLATNPLRNKPVVVVGASTGMFGAMWAQAELRKVLAATGARVVVGELPLPRAHEGFDDNGRLVQDEHALRLQELLDALLELVETRELSAAAAA